MMYQVLLKSAAPKGLTLELIRALASLRVSVLPLDSPETLERCQLVDAPLVTIARHPGELGELPLPRPWISVLPEDEGSSQAFLEAGASVVLRWPVERPKLLSAVARHLADAGSGKTTADD